MDIRKKGFFIVPSASLQRGLELHTPLLLFNLSNPIRSINGRLHIHYRELSTVIERPMGMRSIGILGQSFPVRDIEY
jgi:hypothetical protein